MLAARDPEAFTVFAAQDLGVLWTLTKDGHDARAAVRGIDGIGFQLRYVWDADLRVSELFRDGPRSPRPPLTNAASSKRGLATTGGFEMKATVTFTPCVQDSQDYGSNDEHMVSRVFFDLEVDGKIHSGLYADLKQVVGSNYETGDIEVGLPHGYPDPFNHLAFRDAAEGYFRSLVGPRVQGSASRWRLHPDEKQQIHCDES